MHNVRYLVRHAPGGSCGQSCGCRADLVRAVAVGLVVLAGCSGSDPAPIDAPTGHPGTAPPTTTASATPTQDPGPAAIAAVQRMFDAYNAMLKSGSSTAYRATFTKACTECVSDADAAEASLHEGPATSKAGSVTVSGVRVDRTVPELKLVAREGTVKQRAADDPRTAQGRGPFRRRSFDARSVGMSPWSEDRWLVSQGDGPAMRRVAMLVLLVVDLAGSLIALASSQLAPTPAARILHRSWARVDLHPSGLELRPEDEGVRPWTRRSRPRTTRRAASTSTAWWRCARRIPVGARDTLCGLAVSCPDLTDANGETLKATLWQALRARKAHGGQPRGSLAAGG